MFRFLFFLIPLILRFRSLISQEVSPFSQGPSLVDKFKTRLWSSISALLGALFLIGSLILILSRLLDLFEASMLSQENGESILWWVYSVSFVIGLASLTYLYFRFQKRMGLPSKKPKAPVLVKRENSQTSPLSAHAIISGFFNGLEKGKREYQLKKAFSRNEYDSRKTWNSSKN